MLVAVVCLCLPQSPLAITLYFKMIICYLLREMVMVVFVAVAVCLRLPQPPPAILRAPLAPCQTPAGGDETMPRDEDVQYHQCSCCPHQNPC